MRISGSSLSLLTRTSTHLFLKLRVLSGGFADFRYQPIDIPTSLPVSRRLLALTKGFMVHGGFKTQTTRSRPTVSKVSVRGGLGQMPDENSPGESPHGCWVGRALRVAVVAGPETGPAKLMATQTGHVPSTSILFYKAATFRAQPAFDFQGLDGFWAGACQRWCICVMVRTHFVRVQFQCLHLQ